MKYIMVNGVNSLVSSLAKIAIFSVLVSCEQDDGQSANDTSKNHNTDPTSVGYSSRHKNEVGLDTNALAQLYGAGFSGINPADAKRLLEQLNASEASMEDRVQASGMIISELVKQGKVGAALELIQPTYGAVRDEQLKCFFGGLEDMHTIQMQFQSLKNDHDRLQAIRGLIGNFGTSRLSKLDKIGIEWNRANRDLMAGMIAESLMISNDTQSGQELKEQAVLAVEQIVALYDLEILDVDALQVILDGNQYLEAGEVIRLLDQMNAVKPTDKLNPIYQNVLRDLAATDPDGAMVIALQRNDKAGLMSAVVQGYYIRDADKAAQWFTSHISKMTDSQHDAGTRVIANQLIQQGDFDTATVWISKLRYAVMRENMNRRLSVARQNTNAN